MTHLCETRAEDGYRLRYRVWEPSALLGAQVVLLNGIMSNARWFEPLAAPLTAAGLRLVGADRRGSAENHEGWGDAPSAATLVDDVLRIIAAEDRPDVPLFVVGWCWGATLAVPVALKLGQRLRGLVFITPGFHPTAQVKAALAAQAACIETMPLDYAGIESPIQESYFTHGPALQDFIERDAQRVRVMTPRLLDISRKLGGTAVARLAKLEIPMLLVLAEHEDATDNAATQATFARLPAAQWSAVRLPTRHGVQFEAPQALADHMLGWIRRLEEGPRP